MRTVHVGEIAQLVAPELGIVDVSDDSSDDQDFETPRRSFIGPASLATVLVMGLLGVGTIFWPSSQTIPEDTDVEMPRVLETQELVVASVKHAAAFHAKLGITAEDLQVTEQELEDQLTQAAHEHLRQLMERADQEDPEAARFLRDVRLAPEQWEKAHALLEAAHDDRVRTLGSDLMKGNADHILVSRSEELRKLKDELIPEAQPATGMPWHVFIGPQGELDAEAKLGQWNAALALDTKNAEMEDLAAARRLEAQVPAPAASAGVDPLGRYLMALIGTIITGVFSVAMTIFTAVQRHTAPGFGKAMWILHTSLAGITCGADLGLTIGIKGLQGIFTWVPCIVMAAFSGLEAIWTFAGTR